MKLKLKYLILTLSSVIFLTACPAPEKNKLGCTDPASSNFDPDATIDNGSCEYPDWNSINGPNGGNVYCITVSGSNIFAGTDIGVFLTTNSGATWKEVSNGMDGPLIVLSIAITGSTIIAGTEYGIYRSTNNGNSWTPVFGGYANTIVVSGTTIYAGVDEDGFMQSKDDGNTWTPVENGFPQWVFPPAIAAEGANIYTVVDWFPNFIFSNDNGESWSSIYPGGGEIYSVITSGTNVFIGTESGVFLSTDFGKHWIAKNNGLPIMDIYSMAASGTKIFAGNYGNGVYVSDDNGDTWAPFNENLTEMHVVSLTVSGKQIYAGTAAGVFKRTF